MLCQKNLYIILHQKVHKLLKRNLHNNFPDNSIYTWFPMSTPTFMESNKNLPPQPAHPWNFERPVWKWKFVVAVEKRNEETKILSTCNCIVMFYYRPPVWNECTLSCYQMILYLNLNDYPWPHESMSFDFYWSWIFFYLLTFTFWDSLNQAL